MSQNPTREVKKVKLECTSEKPDVTTYGLLSSAVKRYQALHSAHSYINIRFS
jgi:hypothetical protein